MVFRFAAGISLAGLYMPGLKLLSDYTEGDRQSRYISFYTASFSIGASLSYLLAGECNSLLGWRWTFIISGLVTLSAYLVVLRWAPKGRIQDQGISVSSIMDFRPVFRSRETMAYVLAYAAHMWELFSMRSWMVAFLVYSRQLQPADVFTWSPTQVVALVNLIGLPASIGGNELSRRFGRQKTVTWIMLASVLCSAVIGFTASLPYFLVVMLCLLYGILVVGDSASLTAGAVSCAPEGLRGATLAVHSTIGFGAALVGPLAVGVVLDWFGGNGVLGWGFAFLCMGAGCALGPIVLKILGRQT
jgi:MFS family permease